MVQSDCMKKTVFIIGSKGIPAKYGGFETFVEKIVEYQKSTELQYYVACMSENSKKSNIFEKQFIYKGAKCFNIEVPKIGPAKAIYYDVLALKEAISIAEKNRIEKPIFYILACRIGPFIGHYKKKIEQLGGQLFVNPDGHEWLREKWSVPVRKYWKISESLMVKHADLLVCDSINIENYIQKDYVMYYPKTTYIAYGTDLDKSSYTSVTKEVVDWFSEKQVNIGSYYLVVGRFVPENNYEAMIKGFMASSSKKDFILITNVETNKFYESLKAKTGFDKDKRIKFVGTVYNQELLKYIRENAFAYFHGHEVGGTNPSLLEALASTSLNLLLDVSFNREVGQEGAIYWKKDDLSKVIDSVEKLSIKEIEELHNSAFNRVKENFSWEYIIKKYERLFLDEK